jgi:hypothetical protein
MVTLDSVGRRTELEERYLRDEVEAPDQPKILGFIAGDWRAAMSSYCECVKPSASIEEANSKSASVENAIS